MDNFDELAGRIEGLARAVLLLAEMMERETCMDGMTLTRQWRLAGGAEPRSGMQDSAGKTLHALAKALDDARSRHQESAAAAQLADPALEQARFERRPPVGHRQIDALIQRMSQAEHRLDQMDGTAAPRPHERRAR